MRYQTIISFAGECVIYYVTIATVIVLRMSKDNKQSCLFFTYEESDTAR